MKAMTKEEFIEKSKKIHGDKFDYSKIEYKNLSTKMIIGCKACGEWFEQSPESHLKGNGHRGCKANEAHKKEAEDFFKTVKELYHNKYDYSKTVYISSSDDITAWCPEHGYFTMNVNNHKRGWPCRKCAEEISKKKRIDTFVEQAKKVHPEYDYSNIKYKSCDEPAIIRCYKHREFEIIPHNWLKGYGSCPDCDIEMKELKRKEEEKEFLEQAYKKFKNKFDFSNIKFKNKTNLITFKCNDCGNVITSTPLDLLSRKIGCKECAKHCLTRPFEDFLKAVEEKHGSNIKLLNPEKEYKNENSLMSVKCNRCGKEYPQSAKNLITSKYSCNVCAGRELAKNKDIFKPMSKEEFIRKSIKAHPGEEYDYSKVVYINYDTPVEIYCPRHKWTFWQKPRIHYNGGRCKFCSKDISKAELRIFSWLKENKIELIFEKEFDDLKDKDYLSYDFYIEEYNLLIEYNGRQHYDMETFGKTWEEFLTQKHHDWLKRKYANKNRFNYLVIPYWEEENIEKILEEKIKIHKAA